MGAPKPWITPWPEPTDPDEEPDSTEEPSDPDSSPLDYPLDEPVRLPEDRDLPVFSSVTWGVTHPCNLRCKHCYDVVDFHRFDLSTTEAIQVIDRLVAVKVNFIVFSGGEPLLRKDLLQLMHHCATHHVQFSMRSNATRINTGLAMQLAQAGIAVVGVSLDGATEQTHNDIRGNGAFQAALRGIRALVEARVRVNLEIVLSRRNAHEGVPAIRLAEDLGVQEVNFSAITPQGRGKEMLGDMLDHRLWRELTTTLRNESLTAKVSVSPSCALAGTCWSCIEPNITCDGWVTPCYLSSRKLFNILATPIDEIRDRLMLARPQNLDVCGRQHYLSSPRRHSDRGEQTIIPLSIA